MTGSSTDLLLRGAFLDGDAALTACNDWLSTNGLDSVDPDCFPLVPLLHRKLEALGAEHPELDRLEEARQQTWLQNQMVLREAAEALKSLDAAGIDALLLGGLALVTGYYRDPGLRPIRQIEILVRPRDAVRAAGVLALGSYRVALRRRAMFLGCPPRIERAWWEAALPVEVQEVEGRVLAPEEQLLHTLVTASQPDRSPAAWWMADALTVLSETGVDAARIAELAGRLRVTLFARRALERIGAVLGQPPSPEVLDQLSLTPISWADQQEYDYVCRPGWRRPLLSWLIAPPRRFYRSHS